MPLPPSPPRLRTSLSTAGSFPVLPLSSPRNPYARQDPSRRSGRLVESEEACIKNSQWLWEFSKVLRIRGTTGRQYCALGEGYVFARIRICPTRPSAIASSLVSLPNTPALRQSLVMCHGISAYPRTTSGRLAISRSGIRHPLNNLASAAICSPSRRCLAVQLTISSSSIRWPKIETAKSPTITVAGSETASTPNYSIVVPLTLRCCARLGIAGAESKPPSTRFWSNAYVAAFRDARHAQSKAKNTARLELALLDPLFNVAIKGWPTGLIYNPVPNIRKPSPGEGCDRRLETGEHAKLFTTVRRHNNPLLTRIVQLAIEAGLRQSEILGLRPFQGDADRRIVRLTDTKNDSA